jgi:hypothetical protein
MNDQELLKFVRKTLLKVTILPMKYKIFYS